MKVLHKILFPDNATSKSRLGLFDSPDSSAHWLKPSSALRFRLQIRANLNLLYSVYLNGKRG